MEACSDYSLSAKVRYSSKFKKDFKVIVKRGYDISLFEEVLNLLREEKPLPEKYSDHALKGDYIGHRECHITPDWLLIYKKENDMITLSLTRTGSHSDLF
ncbi:MAG: type II toxin-antitoxin system YafQ family toxin [Clostridia bacterium]|nr:type II toxin-antitoxin system YafQ family toxin [Clostridia bacterium]